MLQKVWLFLIIYDNVWLWQSHHDGIFIYKIICKFGNFEFLWISGVALAMNDFSSGIMTASAGDDNSTKELKGFVVLCLKLLNDMIL